MALNCSVGLNVTAYQAGASTMPMAIITVYNPNATSVAVTGIQMSAVVYGHRSQRLPMGQSVPPTGPGQNTLVAAGGTVTIGPFPLSIGSAAYPSSNAPAIQEPTFATYPINPQPTATPSYVVVVGATVFGSDLSSNTASTAGFTLSSSFPPAFGSQGGAFDFSVSQNSANLFTGLL